MVQKITILLLFIYLFTNPLKAQNYLGVHSSNYAGVMGLDIQPASFVDGRFIVDVNLFSADVTGLNSIKKFDTRDMPGWWIKSFSKETEWKAPDSTFMKRYMLDNYELGTGKNLGAFLSTQIDLLNFAFHINPRIAIGFGIKGRAVVNVDNASPELVRLLTNELNVASLFNEKLSDQNANLSGLAWREYKFNYGQVLYNKEKHMLKAGVGIKLLQGVSSAYMYTKDFNYGLSTEDISFLLAGDFSYGYSEDLDGLNFQVSDFWKRSTSKLGVGFDIGVVYEWRPKYLKHQFEMDGKTSIWRQEETKYKLRVGASLLDVGGMRFKKGGYSRDFTVNEQNPFNLMIFKDAKDLATFDKLLDSLILIDPDWNEKEHSGEHYYHNLPTAISLQLDYKIWNHFVINATGYFNLISKTNESRVRVANQVSVTPGYDFAWAGFYVPMSYNSYTGFKVGLATRLGPITFGVMNLNAVMASGTIDGAQVYAGLRVPILYSTVKDSDNDKVSDRLDQCRDVPGIWKFRGCPDTDGDGIQDSEDDCPTEAGLAEYNGCPDRDMDGIKDVDDECPDVPGLRAFKGCPDTDNDGIRDSDDLCPNEAGPLELNGCPDSDKDGIIDRDDACPDMAGPIEYNGCPDTDGDGVLDFLDNCMYEAGPVENNGCPYVDTDGDGVLDKDDKCPTIKGPRSNQGCPYQDSDNDGVIDSEDDCPHTPGPISNKGCPVIEEQVKEILKTAFDNLEFETGRDVIKETSKPSLNELADLLVKKADWKLQISGHTDNVGNAQSNLILSKKRAEAVKNYLISKGIEAKRFSVLYFGQTDPIADNNTAEGRQKNRRVEMSIIFE